MTNILFIDTSKNTEIRVGLTLGGKEYLQTYEVKGHSSQQVLRCIDAVLKAYSCPISDISEITVSSTSGSFTGIRVGVSVANALGWYLQIPVNGRMGVVEPTYEN